MIRTALSFSTIVLVSSLLIAKAIYSSENTDFQYPERAFYLAETKHNLLNTPIPENSANDPWSKEMTKKMKLVEHRQDLLEIEGQVSAPIHFRGRG